MENCYLPEGSLMDTDMNVMYTSSLRMLEKAMYKGAILEGVCTVCDCRDMSLRIDLGCCEGIIPRDEVQLSSDGKDIGVITRVGKPCAFKVMEVVSGIQVLVMVVPFTLLS